MPFQFQYGAIEGGMCRQQLGLIPQFQFQYGAIEGHLVKVKQVNYNHFNSSMVRLKDKISTLHKIPFADFNSSMVRLKEVSPKTIPCLVSEFQFQYGAIEGERFFIAELFPIPFQFQYGAIEGKRAISFTKHQMNFNSSMVRLKVRTDVQFYPWHRYISIPVWCD